MNNYKIAIYAICKNEDFNVDSWMESMFEADYICILDTGSTDNTYLKLEEWKNKYPNKIFIDQKIYKPWRFDTPRNDSMKLIPSDTDICMCTDLDERLISGWGNDLRAIWTPDTSRVWYKYAWSHTESGDPGRVFWYDKIHSYGDWNWRFPVHESLTYIGKDKLKENNVKTLDGNKIYLHHYPAPKESRSNYLPLLELRAKENLDDFYGLVYLAHEYFYQAFYQQCINFILQVVLPKIPENDEYLCRTDLYLFLGKSSVLLGNFLEAEKYFKNGIKSNSTYRENYLDLAELYIERQKYYEAILLINEMLLNTHRYYSWLEWDTSWTYEPYDILSIAYYYLNQKDAALDYAKLAYSLDQSNERLKNNYLLIENEINKKESN